MNERKSGEAGVTILLNKVSSFRKFFCSFSLVFSFTWIFYFLYVMFIAELNLFFGSINKEACKKMVKKNENRRYFITE